MPDRRPNNVGLLRVVLALLVLLSHAPELADGDRHREILSRIFGTLSFGEAAVDGFFLLSGYLITASYEHCQSTAQYLLRRVARIYPGYAMAYLLSVLAVAPLAGAAPLNAAALPHQIAGLLLLREPMRAGAFAAVSHARLNGSLWTIGYEFECYLLLAALGPAGMLCPPQASAAFLKKRCKRLLAIGARVAATQTYYNQTLFGSFFQKIPAFLPRPRHPCAPLGTIQHQSRLVLIHRSVALPLLVAVVALRMAAPDFGNFALYQATGHPWFLLRFLQFFLSGAVFYLFRRCIRYTPAAIAAAILLCGGFLFLPGTADLAVAWPGGYLLFYLAFHAPPASYWRFADRTDLSYGIYLYGWPVECLLIQWRPTMSPWAVFGVSVPLCAVAAWASWRLVEYPVLRWAHNTNRR